MVVEKTIGFEMKNLFLPTILGVVCFSNFLFPFNPQTNANLKSSNLEKENDHVAKPAIRTTQAETVRKASEDLRLGKEGMRVGAAKLLGKYPSLQSSVTLVGALDDSSALVRRAAMVSLAEHSSNGHPLYEKSLVEKVFSKLGDSDVEVRREVSSMIPKLISGLMRGGMEITEINGRKVYRSVPARLRTDLFELTLRSFLDEDAIVRQNLLKYHPYLRVDLPASILIRLLGDDDSGVMLAALDRVSANADHPDVLAEIGRLCKNPSKGIRLKVIDVARDSSRHHAGYRSILRSMTKDEDLEVTSMAAVELARFGERIPKEVISDIKKYLLSSRGMNSQVTTILYAVSAMGEDGMEVYLSLTEHSSSRMRADAWQRYLSMNKTLDQSSTWMSALKDRDKGVRDAVIVSLRGRIKDLNADEVGELVASEFADVRIFAGQSMVLAEEEILADYGFELLIDENPLVRSTTLRAFGMRRPPGWIAIMSKSLLDKDYDIQRAAMDALLGDRELGVEALLKYLEKNPTARISSLAKSELYRLGVQP